MENLSTISGTNLDGEPNAAESESNPESKVSLDLSKNEQATLNSKPSAANVDDISIDFSKVAIEEDKCLNYFKSSDSISNNAVEDKCSGDTKADLLESGKNNLSENGKRIENINLNGIVLDHNVKIDYICDPREESEIHLNANISHTETNVIFDSGSTNVNDYFCSSGNDLNNPDSLQTIDHDEASNEKTQPEAEVLDGIGYVVYENEHQMPDIMRLITKDLSEPYSIYTYRYFIHNWPKLCFLAMDGPKCVGAIVCKLDYHKKKLVRRGYIAMLAVDSQYRRRQIGSTLVTKAINAMISDDCGEVVLETEITNLGALRLYENLGFVRDKRLFRYYLNGVDALRLKLWLS